LAPAPSASQISSVTRSNDLYAWTGHTNANLSSTPNGLNQIGNVGAGFRWVFGGFRFSVTVYLTPGRPYPERVIPELGKLSP
jgi:hypothetical protein